MKQELNIRLLDPPSPSLGKVRFCGSYFVDFFLSSYLGKLTQAMERYIANLSLSCKQALIIQPDMSVIATMPNSQLILICLVFIFKEKY